MTTIDARFNTEGRPTNAAGGGGGGEGDGRTIFWEADFTTAPGQSFGDGDTVDAYGSGVMGTVDGDAQGDADGVYDADGFGSNDTGGRIEVYFPIPADELVNGDLLVFEGIFYHPNQGDIVAGFVENADIDDRGELFWIRANTDRVRISTVTYGDLANLGYTVGGVGNYLRFRISWFCGQPFMSGTFVRDNSLANSMARDMDNAAQKNVTGITSTSNVPFADGTFNFLCLRAGESVGQGPAALRIPWLKFTRFRLS